MRRFLQLLTLWLLALALPIQGAAAPLFLTGGTDRSPRSLLA